MKPFVVTVDTPLDLDVTWRRITDWAAHANWVPFTTIEVTTPPPNGLGTVFTAHSGVGRLGFDDPMEVVEWEPPTGGRGGRCRLQKRGRVILGWAEISVEPHGAGSRATWREDAGPAKLPGFAVKTSDLASRLLFGRVLRGLLAP
ncbi:MAG: SRPBCC family protein [Jatrophihabitans sp.]